LRCPGRDLREVEVQGCGGGVPGQDVQPLTEEDGRRGRELGDLLAVQPGDLAEGVRLGQADVAGRELCAPSFQEGAELPGDGHAAIVRRARDRGQGAFLPRQKPAAVARATQR
jgi:hypothetical protein